MTLAIVPLTPLEPGLRGVFRVRAAGFWSVVLAAGIAAELWFRDVLPIAGMAAGPLLLVWLWRVLIAPPRTWRRWGYAFTGSEVHVAHGLIVESCTIVPVSRIQHFDIIQGPIERMFGVCTLAVHTAGTDASVVPVPGLSRVTAESIRDAIRLRIGSATE
jgi:membrane protein YdbS with pleckstrin-like domain